jgi:cytochrome c556
MRSPALLLSFLLMTLPAAALAADAQPVPNDPRFGVHESPVDAAKQKTEMRNNLVALRSALSSLAEKDFDGVENAVRRLAHSGPVAQRPGVTTEIFRDMEKQFEAQVDKTVVAARSRNVDTVLRELAETMGYCQSCHMTFRQAVEPAAEGTAPKAP